MALEEKVLAKNPYKLRHYSLKMASGATPTVVEVSKYYADKATGIPFIRVQNLNETGLLSLDDLKYINQETHNSYLKRSQVQEDDLLIKITGVGRMAVAGVPPKGFVGNINQHSVVVKTQDRKTSEVLAAYLNSDIGEKLASRRSTGGTRPALDYTALKSIPIVYEPLLIELAIKAREKKKKRDDEALELFNKIDIYIQEELNIIIPEQKTEKIQERIFKSKLISVQGNRFDAGFNKPYYQKIEKIFENKHSIKFHNLIKIITKGETPLWRGDEYVEKGIPFIKVQNISPFGIVGDITYINEETHFRMKRSQLKGGEILYTMAGSIGNSIIFPANISEANINQAIAKIVLKDNVSNEFINFILNSSICKVQAQRLLTTSAQPNINFEQIKSLRIPFPSLLKQSNIVNVANDFKNRSIEIRKKGESEFQIAKTEIENLILA